jgi:hypothetical protein
VLIRTLYNTQYSKYKICKPVQNPVSCQPTPLRSASLSPPVLYAAEPSPIGQRLCASGRELVPANTLRCRFSPPRHQPAWPRPRRPAPASSTWFLPARPVLPACSGGNVGVAYRDEEGGAAGHLDESKNLVATHQRDFSGI